MRDGEVPVNNYFLSHCTYISLPHRIQCSSARSAVAKWETNPRARKVREEKLQEDIPGVCYLLFSCESSCAAISFLYAWKIERYISREYRNSLKNFFHSKKKDPYP